MINFPYLISLSYRSYHAFRKDQYVGMILLHRRLRIKVAGQGGQGTNAYFLDAALKEHNPYALVLTARGLTSAPSALCGYPIVTVPDRNNTQHSRQ
ncbi:hypothetical protein CPC08DRAFT_397199 [Agrocybe pediades]|nr:hypothetical protein CPC08DRAFT_397199 [Agrocybe pediades]